MDQDLYEYGAGVRSISWRPLPHEILRPPRLLSQQPSDLISTARKRSLRRLCFHGCLSVHRGVPGQVPLAGTPSRQVHPPVQVSPARYTPSRYTPWAGTPRQVHPQQVHPLGKYPPPATVHAETRSRSGRYASHFNVFLSEICFVDPSHSR